MVTGETRGISESNPLFYFSAMLRGPRQRLCIAVHFSSSRSGSFGYRPKKSAHAAIQRVSKAILEGKTYVIDFDLRSYFDTVRHHIVLEKVARRVDDDAVLWLLKLLLDASGKQGVPQGGVISPLLSNLYLNEVDQMLERAKAVTRHERWTAVEYARFADDLVILVDSHPRQQWLRQAVEKRLREELAKLQVEVNEEKSRKVDLQRGESFGFLGFEFRRDPESPGTMDAAVIAEGQEADGLARQAQRDLPGLSFPAGGRGDREDQSDPARLGEILRHRPLESVFLLHPRLGRKEDSAPSGPGVPASRLRLEAVEQGMAVRNAGTLLGVPRILWAVDLGSRSSLIGLITLDVKCAGARSAGNPHATCDVAGAGNQFTVRLVRHSQRKRGATARPNLRNTAPVLIVDPETKLWIRREEVLERHSSGVSAGLFTAQNIC